VTELLKFIDHSLLRPDTTEKEIIALCEEAVRYGFHSVCVHPCCVSAAARQLKNSHVRIAAVIAFPHGMTLSRVKVYEAMETVLLGADELDIVMNIGMARSGHWDDVEKELSDIITATPGALHKIIIETCLLSEDEKIRACEAVMRTGAEFIKTSTGFGPSGAAVRDVELLRSITRGAIGIKASGGIRTLAQVEALIKAGASRIGTSSGREIAEELRGKTK